MLHTILRAALLIQRFRPGRPRHLTIGLAAILLLGAMAPPAGAAEEYLLGPGDVMKIVVFKNPDLTTDARVSEAGTISYPLLGSVPVGGLTLSGAERKISQMLKDGGFVNNPQVNILLTLAVSNQVAVLGEVNKPGRYPIEGAGGNLTGVLAEAGGISPTGADVVIVTGTRGGKPFRREVDVVKMSMTGSTADDIEMKGGDTIFVNRAPMFYIYGQVQRAGSYRIEKGMTVMQALADGGGVTGKGSTRGMVLRRRDAQGKIKETKVSLDDEVHDQDVIYVKESLF
jgi:polysaccharide export outer membrane protein